jgi:predicted Zn-dependent protease
MVTAVSPIPWQEGLRMDDQRAHLRYVISLAPYGSRSEAFFRAASGDEEILGELRRRAEAAHDAAAAAHYQALALAASGRASQAVSLFQQLVEAFPDEERYRLNLSVTYAFLGQLDLCESELNEIARRSSDSGTLADVRARLAAVSADRRQELEARQASLQTTVLRKKAHEGTASQEEAFLLARQLFGTAMAGTSETGWSEATAFLESASERFPDDVRFLEFLATCYTIQYQDEQLNALIPRLQRLAPESSVLAQVKAAIQAEEPGAGMPAGSDERRAQAWFQQAAEDRPSAEEAVRELSRLVNRFPMNPRYRMYYAQALFVRGHHDQALHQADVLAPLVGTGYIGNYNIGQIYARCGQPVKGQHHLEIALAAATTEQDRDDASEMLTAAQRLSAG